MFFALFRLTKKIIASGAVAWSQTRDLMMFIRLLPIRPEPNYWSWCCGMELDSLRVVLPIRPEPFEHVFFFALSRLAKKIIDRGAMARSQTRDILMVAMGTAH